MHVEAPAVERVVDGTVLVAEHAVPELLHLVDEAIGHVAAKDRSQIGYQFGLGRCGKQLQRGVVDAQHLQHAHAFGDPGGFGAKVRPQILDTLGMPAIEKLVKPAEVLQPK